MAFPRYKTYCFYTTVKTGTIKLAIFFLFCGGCTIISSSVGLVNYTPINEDQINQAKVNSTVSYHVFLKVAFFQKVQWNFFRSPNLKKKCSKKPSWAWNLNFPPITVKEGHCTMFFCHSHSHSHSHNDISNVYLLVLSKATG